MSLRFKGIPHTPFWSLIDPTYKEEGCENVASQTQEEDSGGSCDYYRVKVYKPTTAEHPYVAECNDVIEELDMTYAEANIFKEIWRTAAARTLGKKKAGHTNVRGAEKVLFFAKRNAILNGVEE